MKLLASVRQAIRAHGLIRPGDRGAVALSGGVDSLALLHALRALASEIGFSLLALTVDHGLRVASASEAQAAADRARGMGVSVHVLAARPARHIVAAPPGNVQQFARQLRLALLESWATENDLHWVALAHTQTDQAETVLMRAVRGSNVSGLSAMQWRRGIFVRPLLGVGRREVEAYAAQEGLCPVEDPSNATDRYLRNRLRHQVLPLLRRENPRVERALAELAFACQEVDAAVEEAAASLLASALREEAGGGRGARAIYDATVVARAPQGIRLRALRRMFADATGGTRRLGRVHLVALDQFARACAGTRAVDLPGARAVRTYDRMQIEATASTTRSATQPGFAPVEVHGPGRYILSDGRAVVVSIVGSSPAPGSNERCASQWIAPGKVQWPLIIRPRRAGDRLRTAQSAHRPVARLLIDAKIPRAERDKIIVVESAGRPVLVVGVRAEARGEPLAPDAGAGSDTVHIGVSAAQTEPSAAGG